MSVCGGSQSTPRVGLDSSVHAALLDRPSASARSAQHEAFAASVPHVGPVPVSFEDSVHFLRARANELQKQTAVQLEFDPVTQFGPMVRFLQRHGFVVVRGVVDKDECARLADAAHQWLSHLGTGIVPYDWTTYTNLAMPENYTTGVLDGLVPARDMTADSGADAWRRHQGQIPRAFPTLPDRLTVLHDSSDPPEGSHADGIGGGGHYVHGGSSRREICLVRTDRPESQCQMPSYHVSSPFIPALLGEKCADEDHVVEEEARQLCHHRFRVDTLCHDQSAWNLRTDPRLYRLFSRLIPSARGHLVTSIDVVHFQRPVGSQPPSAAEDWKNYERRPLWEWNPFVSDESAIDQDGGDGGGLADDGGGGKRKRRRRREMDPGEWSRKCTEASEMRHGLPFGPYQGLIALTDADETSGAVRLVPGFHHLFDQYARRMASEWGDIHSDLVRSKVQDPQIKRLLLDNAIPVPVRRGSFLLLDRRVPRFGAINHGTEATCMLRATMAPWRVDRVHEASVARALSVRYGIRFCDRMPITGHISGAPRWKQATSDAAYAGYIQPALTELGLCLNYLRPFSRACMTAASAATTPATITTGNEDDGPPHSNREDQ